MLSAVPPKNYPQIHPFQNQISRWPPGSQAAASYSVGTACTRFHCANSQYPRRALLNLLIKFNMKCNTTELLAAVAILKNSWGQHGDTSSAGYCRRKVQSGGILSQQGFDALQLFGSTIPEKMMETGRVRRNAGLPCFGQTMFIQWSRLIQVTLPAFLYSCASFEKNWYFCIGDTENVFRLLL